MKKRIIGFIVICFIVGFWSSAFGQEDLGTVLLKQQIRFTNQIMKFFDNTCKLRNAGVDKTHMLAIFEKIGINRNSEADKLVYHYLKTIINRIYDIPKSLPEYELEISKLKISILQESPRVGMNMVNSMGD